MKSNMYLLFLSFTQSLNDKTPRYSTTKVLGSIFSRVNTPLPGNMKDKAKSASLFDRQPASFMAAFYKGENKGMEIQSSFYHQKVLDL